MTKWHAHVAHMAKQMDMVGGLFGGGPWARAPCLPPKSGADLLGQADNMIDQ